MARGNERNLTKSFNKIDPKEAQAIRSKGAKASAKARKLRSEMKKRIELILELPAKNLRELEKLGFNTKDSKLDNYTIVALALFNQAKKGNVRAIEQIAMGFDREEAMIKKLEAEAAILKKQLTELQQEKEVDKLDALLKGIGALAEDEINS